MLLEIITPEKKVYEGEIVSVTLPGTEGSFQLLNNHSPLVSTLKKGKIVVADKNNQNTEVAVNGGVVEVNNNKVIVLAEI